MSPNEASRDTGNAKDIEEGPPALNNTEEHSLENPMQEITKKSRGIQFWMCCVSLILPTFSVGLDVAAVSTPLPLIIRELHGKEFEWVGSAYALAATAFQPLCGGLAQVFGRKMVMLLNLFLFALGSAICGAAPNLNVLIFGRAVQGTGSGGILAIGQIIIGDLVTLRERGSFNAFFSLAYALSTASGPVVGAALAQHGQWRWIFYMNIPICGLSASIACYYLNLKTPVGTWKEKIARLDWIGNAMVMGSTTACILGLTWGGIEFPWGSFEVVIPLAVGLSGLIAFIVFESRVPKEPLVPPSLLSNRTAVSGYIQSFITSFMILSSTYYLPVYYQACKGESLISSAIDTFGLAQTMTPFAFAASIFITKTGRYRPPIWFAWLVAILSNALLSTVNVDTTRAVSIGYQVLLSLAVGILYPSAQFPVLSSLPVTLNAPAFAFYAFVRYFAQVWGITIGGMAIQNRLSAGLPPEFLAQFPEGTSVAYSVIPAIASLPEPLKRQVRDSFADGLRVQWLVLVGMSTLGLATSLFMKGITLHKHVDENWALQNHDLGNQEETKDINTSRKVVA